jgi:hypothetical protein
LKRAQSRLNGAQSGLNGARFLVDRLALNLQFSETLFSFHSSIISGVENPATVKSSLF